MKRILLLAVAFMISIAPMFAQTKVDKEGIEKKIAKSDVDIANPKKNIKSAVWLDRGKVFYEADQAPVQGLHKGLEVSALEIIFGKSEKESKSIGNTKYEVRVYDTFEVYMHEGKVFTWEPTMVIFPDALKRSYEAYSKAHEVDTKAESKVKAGIIFISDAYKQRAENLFMMQKYGDSADAFHDAYEVKLHPAVNDIDTASVYNAGFLNTLAHKFDKALDDLKVAQKYGYDNDGDIYYYMFHCYFGLDDIANAKQILLEGIAKYPGNTKIVEGLLGIYSATEGSDPNEIIPVVEQSIEKDPNNVELWSGLGRVYDKLGNEDKAIEAFTKAVELAPDDAGTNFNLGFLYIKKGDDMNKELNSAPQTSQAAYNEGLTKVNAVYAMCIPYLEKAHQASPENIATIELLKNVSFRLRDEEGIMDKYNKYNELHKQMNP